MRSGRAWRFGLVQLALASALCGASVEARGQAQTPCPKEAQASKSIELSSRDGRKSVITWLDGNRTRIVEPNAKPVREITLVRGLLALEIARPDAKARITYLSPTDPLFPLRVGQQHEIAYVSQVEGQKAFKGIMTIAVVEAVQHAIGACTYDAVLLGRFSAFEDGKVSAMRYDVYAPALQAVLKSAVFDDAGKAVIEAETFEFDAIVQQ